MQSLSFKVNCLKRVFVGGGQILKVIDNNSRLFLPIECMFRRIRLVVALCLELWTNLFFKQFFSGNFSI